MSQPPSGLHDTGARHIYPTGAVREPRDPEKGRYDLIPAYPHHRLAVHFARGIVKYSPDNWMKGLPLSSYVGSIESHLVKFKDGDRSEDHMSAIVWNAYCYEWTEREIREGRLPKDLDDRGYVK